MKDDLKVEKGVFYINKDDENKRNRYKGYCKNDKREGKGIIYYNNEYKYKGNYKNDKNEGKGKYYYNIIKIKIDN